MARFREPVIGDEFDLETYGLPSSQRPDPATAPRVRPERPRPSRSEHGAARARRFNSHRPVPRETSRRAERAAARSAAPEVDAVRTVQITGNPTPARRSSFERTLSLQLDRYDRRPDRAAQWALFLGLFMVAIAVITGS